MGFLCYFIMLFSVLVLLQARAGAKDVCDTFNVSFANLAKWSFTGLVSATLHWISSNSLFLWSTKEIFGLSFQLSFPQPLPLFTLIVAFCFPQKLSMYCSSLPLFQSVFLLFFLAHIDNVLFLVEFNCCGLAWLEPSYSLLHALPDCISPLQHSPRHLLNLLLHHFLQCRICLHMTFDGVPYI